MAYQSVFKRYEIKYIINHEQKNALLSAMASHMTPDKYGHSVIRNIYFDTDSFRLIRRSIEKPIYKEKLRIRAYALAKPESNIFVELKKKYRSVVYKRRLSLPEHTVMEAFEKSTPLPVNSQIGDEIEYFRNYYGNLSPKIFISYEREAFLGIDDPSLRITFDENIMYRDTDLSLLSPPYGKTILPEGLTLMEIKTFGAIPLWLTKILTENRIFKTSFSKYGIAYEDILKNKGVLEYV